MVSVAENYSYIGPNLFLTIRFLEFVLFNFCRSMFFKK